MSDEQGSARLPRALLESWEVADPLAGAEARLFAELRCEPRRPWWTLRVGVAFAVALALVVFVRRTEGPAPVLRIADRARVVTSSPGVVELVGGGARCRQRPGRAHFEVSPGESFVVGTEAGDVSAAGSEFELEVITMSPAQAFAVSSVAAVITVTAGVVLLSNEHGQLRLEAAQTGVMTAHTGPSRSTPTLASTDRLEAELAQIERQRALLASQIKTLEAASQQQRAEIAARASEGQRPVPWPATLRAELKPPLFEQRVRAIIEAEKVTGSELVEVDCSEYPCMTVLRDVPTDGAALRLDETQQWSSLAGPGGFTYTDTCKGEGLMFLLPDGLEPGDAGRELEAQLSKRDHARVQSALNKMGCPAQ